LKKDEAADLVRKLELEKEKYDSSGLLSSKRLKRKFGDFVEGQVQLNGNVEEDVQPKMNCRKRAAKNARVQDDDAAESVDSFEEEHEEAFDPAAAPAEIPDIDASWLKQRAAPVQGTGLAQPLQIGANGLPIIPVRRGKKQPEQIVEDPRAENQSDSDEVDEADERDSWVGFSDTEMSDFSDEESAESDEDGSEEEISELDPRLKNIDSKVLDALLAELERPDAGSDDSDEDESQGDEVSGDAETADDAESLEDGSEDTEEDDHSTSGEAGSGSDAESDTSNTSVDTKLKPRTSAFKSWATQQLNQSIGHTPFYEQEQPPQAGDAQQQVYAKPAAGYRLGVKDVEPPKDDRRAYSVAVERTESIQETRSQLPILQREQEIMEAIHNNSVVVVKGDTGSGKTTQLPQFLFEAGFGDKHGPAPGLVGITQPRRVAAVSMAKRVAEELGDHGDKVAHQIRFDTTVSSKTVIKFMTDGILLRELSQDLLLRKYSAIVIDEAHERSVNTDLLIGMLSKIVPARMKKSAQNPDPKPLKLIIMSATLNINDFLHEKLFAGNLRPPVVEAEGRQHKVTTHFALRSRPDYIEETIEKVKKAHRKLPKGGMLVFLTGQNEIKHVLSRLRKELVRSAKPTDDSSLPRMQISASDAPLELEDLDIEDYDRSEGKLDVTDDIDIIVDETELDKEFEVSDDEEETSNGAVQATTSNTTNRDPYDTVHLLPLYSQLPTKEQLRIFEPPPDRSRLIVLSTNVAETSLTIPGIRYVFDCGRSKERKFDAETNVQSFEIDYISKASAQQRAGRAGRTGPGHCWRLYSSAVYEQFFLDHTEPEILRTPAENVVLQLKSFRYPRPVTDFPFPSPPGRRSLEKAEKLLRDLGAISGPNGALTDLGKSLSLYPLSLGD
jgi:ATP-dependent RNA helicase DHX37/DHR1